MKIWKFTIPNLGVNPIFLPKDSKILGVAFQHDELTLWAKVDPEKEGCQRDIEVIGTGFPLDPEIGFSRDFLGTVFRGSLVWHVFERTHTSDS